MEKFPDEQEGKKKQKKNGSPANASRGRFQPCL